MNDVINHYLDFIISLIAFACMFVGALVGGFLRMRLPEDHLPSDSRDVVKLGAGLVATMAALALGLLVSSAKNSFDSVNEGLTEASANRVNLDRILDHYGPGADIARDHLRHSLASDLERIWPKSNVTTQGISLDESSTELETVGDILRELTPQNESQRLLKDRAIQIYGEGMKLRWSLIQRTHVSIPTVLLVVLIFWFTVLFVTFGLLTSSNMAVNVVMLVCALSVASGIFLILDMGRPFQGVFRISSAPVENALSHLGR